MELDKIRKKILIDLKPFIKNNGWSKKIFDYLSKDLKYNKQLLNALFAEGYMSILQMYLDEINNKMTKDSKKIDLLRLRTHERIKEIFILRLKIMSKEKQLIKKTFFHLLLPTNYKFSIKNLYITVDQIWFLSGDNSSDFNFYTKRAILASIYFNVILHFINNNELDETIFLLNKKLKKVSGIPKIKNMLGKFINLSPKIFKFRKHIF